SPQLQKIVKGLACCLISACSERGPATASPWGIAGAPCAALCPVWLTPGAGRAWMIGWRGPHEAQGDQGRVLINAGMRRMSALAPNWTHSGHRDAFAERALWNIDATAISFQLDVCRLDDW